MALTTCIDCNSEISDEAIACPKCGRPMRAAPVTIRRRLSRTTAGLLALLLGGVGMHRFYLGKPFSGLFYLLFCWTFIPALIALLEAVVLLSMSDDKFVQQYCV